MIDTAMRLIINGEQLNLEIPEAATFSDVMSGIRQKVVTPKIAMTKVCLNGINITGMDWTEYKSLTADQIESIEIESSDTDVLISETIDSLTEFLTELETELNSISEMFRSGEEMPASERFVSATDGIQIINYTTLKIMDYLGISSDDNFDQEKSYSQILKSMDEVISEMLTAQQRQDWILLADLIEYELVPMVSDRCKLINSIKEKANARQS